MGGKDANVCVLNNVTSIKPGKLTKELLLAKISTA